MGICNLRHLKEEIAKRKVVVERYRERLSSIDVIKISPIQSGVDSNFAYFPIVIYENKFGSSTNEVKAELSKNGIGARKYFYPLTNTFDCFHGQFDEGSTPVALKISLRGELCLYMLIYQ